MSGHAVTGSSGSSTSSASLVPTSEPFRFSPRAHQAHKIQWRVWGEEAFQEAGKLDKPVFLVISSSWCQWCHIMDETTLSDPIIITIVNNDFIPIRVDSDLRPDVNQRYNQNGWPSVVMLSAEGEILWGGVYVPPKQMLYYLGHIRRYYSEHRQEITEQVHELQDRRFTRALSQTLPSTGVRALLEEERVALIDIPASACAVLRDLYDAEYGGFSIHPHLKFPHPEALELLLLARPLEPAALDMVCYSLEQMHEGGLWGQEAGGFFRYSTTSDWSTPHTEKMLEENAALLRLLVLVAQVTGNNTWYERVRRQVLYINTWLWQPGVGVFSGSQSADEEYYEPGPYSRASKPTPHVDTTVYTAWNARVISSYLLAARLLEQPSLDAMAMMALNWLCEHMACPEGGVYHYAIDGHRGLPGQFADQVWMTQALLDAYELHADQKHLELAIDLMHFAYQELLDEQTSLFYDYAQDSHAVGRLRLREQPLTENALAAECLLRMSVHSNRRSLGETGLLVLSGCLEKYRQTGIQGAIYACVVARAARNGWLVQPE